MIVMEKADRNYVGWGEKGREKKDCIQAPCLIDQVTTFLEPAWCFDHFPLLSNLVVVTMAGSRPVFLLNRLRFSSQGLVMHSTS